MKSGSNFPACLKSASVPNAFFGILPRARLTQRKRHDALLCKKLMSVTDNSIQLDRCSTVVVLRKTKRFGRFPVQCCQSGTKRASSLYPVKQNPDLPVSDSDQTPAAPLGPDGLSLTKSCQSRRSAWKNPAGALLLTFMMTDRPLSSCSLAVLFMQPPPGLQFW